MRSDKINEGPLTFAHLEPFAIPSAHWVSHGGENNKQGRTRRGERALSGPCSCISAIIVGSGVQPTHLRDTDIVRETSLPSIQLNQEKVMKIMVKIMVGKMSLLIRDDYCLWKTLQKPVCRPLGQFTWEKRKHCCCTDSDWLPKLMAGKWWVHHPLVYLRTHRTSCKRI